jgi:hypothetical protein
MTGPRTFCPTIALGFSKAAILTLTEDDNGFRLGEFAYFYDLFCLTK